MKKALFTLALFTMANTLFAQQAKPQSHVLKPWHKMQMERVQKMTANAGYTRYKTTEQKQRVVAQAFYKQANLKDSTAYTYSQDRGSLFNVYNLDFSYKQRFEEYFEPYNYPDGTNLPDLLPDSIKNFPADPDDNHGDYVGYYTGDKLDSFICIKDGTPIYKNIKTYNSLRALETSLTVNFNPDPTESMKQVNVYEDNTTKILSDSIYHKFGSDWKLSEYTVYHYNTAHQIDSISRYQSGTDNFNLQNLLALTYNPEGKIAAYEAYINDGTDNMVLEQKSFFTYHQEYEGYSTFKWDEYESGVLMSTVDARCFFGPNGLIDSIVGTVHDHEDDVIEDALVLFSYNDFGNPIKLEQLFDGESEGTLYFYYEDYDVTGITNAKRPALEVYPNPVNNRICIQNADRQSNNPWNISLSDIQGRTVFSQQQNLHAGENVINLPELPKGVYILNIQNAEHGKMSQKIVKQ